LLYDHCGDGVGTGGGHPGCDQGARNETSRSLVREEKRVLTLWKEGAARLRKESQEEEAVRVEKEAKEEEVGHSVEGS